MTHQEYRIAIDTAMKSAGGCPEWNLMFEFELLKRGLVITSEQLPPHPTGNDFMTPQPIIGVYHTYPYPSWIYETDYLMDNFEEIPNVTK